MSSSQAVIGAVLGIALIYGRGRAWKQVRWGRIAQIVVGWVATPVLACLVSFLLLFVVQNVFNERVYRPRDFLLTPAAVQRLTQEGIVGEWMSAAGSQPIHGARAFRRQLWPAGHLSAATEKHILELAEYRPVVITKSGVRRLDRSKLNPEQIAALDQLVGQRFDHRWQLAAELARRSPAWDGSQSDSRQGHIGSLVTFVLDQLSRDAEPMVPGNRP